jgi:hypothetical protein
MSNSFTIKLDDKPNLTKALQENPQLAKQVIGTFVQLIEESFDDSKGITWAELPQQLHNDLTFSDLVKGVLRGALDTKKLNPDAFDALGVEVHPLSILSPRKNYIDGGVKYYDWRGHFGLPQDTYIGSETVEQVIRKLLRYSKIINVETLKQHLEANQIATYRGLGDEQVRKLPFYPALRFQSQKFGDLHVGKFYDDVGFFDCGHNDKDYCPACNRFDLRQIGEYKVCLACNAGYKTEESV